MKQRLYNEWKKLWLEACIYDNIDPASKFVVFSMENPYAKQASVLGVAMLQASKD